MSELGTYQIAFKPLSILGNYCKHINHIDAHKATRDENLNNLYI
jgi:hypothetical protein